MCARSEIHLSVRDQRRVKLDSVLGSIATVRRLSCIVKLRGKIRRIERVEHTGVILEGPYDSS